MSIHTEIYVRVLQQDVHTVHVGLYGSGSLAAAAFSLQF
jgi:hypothetical protein